MHSCAIAIEASHIFEMPAVIFGICLWILDVFYFLILWRREASSISHLFIVVEDLLRLLPVSAVCLWILTLCFSRFSFGCFLVENDNCWAVSWGFPSDLPCVLSRWMRLHLFSSVSSQLLCFTAVCVYAPSLPCLVLGKQKCGSVKEVQGWKKNKFFYFQLCVIQWDFRQIVATLCLSFVF